MYYTLKNHPFEQRRKLVLVGVVLFMMAGFLPLNGSINSMNTAGECFTGSCAEAPVICASNEEIMDVFGHELSNEERAVIVDIIDAVHCGLILE